MALTLSKDSLNAEKAGQWFDRLQSLQITRRLGLMAMIAVAVAAGLSVFFWSQKPGMVPLYTGLDQKATADATDLLRAAQIPFALDPATGGITVPEKNLHDASLKLAGSGLTDSGKLGFELMERDPGFGVSQFVESARYQHALETELSRPLDPAAGAQSAKTPDMAAEMYLASLLVVDEESYMERAYLDELARPL
ncbi:hypothetical protein G6F40_015569 [Rhizopus arrhizus]|nr:hypothetical protein G6F40_015569 [Rhizopus arrhizus]